MEAPEIVVATLWEGGVEGPWAAPIVRDVLKAYFDKKVRLGQPRPYYAYTPPRLLRAPDAMAPTPPPANP